MAGYIDIGAMQYETDDTSTPIDIGAMQREFPTPTVGGIMTTNTGYWGALIILLGLLLLV